MSTDFPPYKDYRIRVEALDFLPDGWKWDAWISPVLDKSDLGERRVIGEPPPDKRISVLFGKKSGPKQSVILGRPFYLGVGGCPFYLGRGGHWLTRLTPQRYALRN